MSGQYSPGGPVRVVVTTGRRVVLRGRMVGTVPETNGGLVSAAYHEVTTIIQARDHEHIMTQFQTN